MISVERIYEGAILIDTIYRDEEGDILTPTIEVQMMAELQELKTRVQDLEAKVASAEEPV